MEHSILWNIARAGENKLNEVYITANMLMNYNIGFCKNIRKYLAWSLGNAGQERRRKGTDHVKYLHDGQSDLDFLLYAPFIDSCGFVFGFWLTGL